MTITIELTPEQERQIRNSVTQHNRDATKRLLGEVAAPVAEFLFLQTQPPLSLEEFERLSDELADEFEAALGPNPPILSDYAMSREGIYEDHP